MRRRLWSAVLLLAGGLAAWELGSAAYVQLKARLAQYLIADAWEGGLAGRPAPKPWPWADTTPVARLTAPRLGIDLIVLHGADGRTLAFGPGHHAATAAPGAPGTTVIAGHRDTHFAFLKDLLRGDELRLTGKDGVERRYRVAHTAIVDSRRARLAASGEGRELVLVTCFPFTALVPGGPLRYVVIAEEAAPPVMVAAAE